ncbi:exopolysaccharide biosynthesis protein [Cohaesibacter celericrescens]|uniref:Exopolysaccharide biosynthesis protein n=1 Tax=Cohaesibacter celericrescens TaxID=2067669 RepID=A0A2N5XRH3_9HYPH|nr:exopolysaccharide biosynthesis protein [Cohaesibacter celericrescens]
MHLFLKRMLDVLGSAFALLVLSPFLLFVIIAIRWETPGSVFFVQERWGKDKSRIKVFKFRSMYAGKCDKSGVAQTKENDSRITKVGAILRKTNIDELPQLLNVLKGDMSLVGPRCHPIGMLAHGERYEDFVPYYHTRHLMKPGITGLAQVNGYRGPTTTFEQAFGRIDHDIEYIRNFSVWMDIGLVFKTVAVELRGGNGF